MSANKIGPKCRENFMQVRSIQIEKVRHLSEKAKKAYIEKLGELAKHYEETYHGCCRSVLKSFDDILKIGNGNIIKAAVPLGAGVARSGETCGVLLGGLMAIGIIYGSDAMEYSRKSEYYKKAMTLGMKLCDLFFEEFGSLRCFDIQKKIYGQKYNLRDPNDVKTFTEVKGKCADVVARMGTILAARVIFDSTS
jgi:C_GCAxxG_C_C family probable redox protein